MASADQAVGAAQGTPSLQRSSRHAQGSQGLSQALSGFQSGVVKQSPMSPPLSCSRTRSTPTPGGQGSYSSAHRPTAEHPGEVRTDYSAALSVRYKCWA